MEIPSNSYTYPSTSAAADAEAKRRAEEAAKKAAEEAAKKAAEEAAKKAAEEAAKNSQPKKPSKLDDINVLDLLLEEPKPENTESETPPVTSTPETRGVSSVKTELETEVERLTEEQAIAQGYTVIKTAEDLKAMKNNPNGKYILMGDIDLSEIDWEPIGTEENPFTGIFNGNGYTISNMNITVDDGPKTENVGFFGCTDGATISNVILKDATISTPTSYNKGSVGTLIGSAKNTNIDNVTVVGATVSGHQKVGGLVGSIVYADGADNKITNVNVDANVNGAYYSGGLIGYIEDLGTGTLLIENTSVTGNVQASKKSAGGFIGEAGSSIVTINKCQSGANVSGVDGAERIGGFIGNANGTKIAICNSKYTGQISAQGDFQGEWYGHYMNDAHVSIFELSAGLPVDDILLIDGVDGLTPIYNDVTGEYEYEISVSTITGLDKVVAMIRENPALADIIVFNVNFDFEAMDGAYTPSEYAQYGVVQHTYEDEEGNVVNDVYIDNELDPYSTFHKPITISSPPSPCQGACFDGPLYEETMIEGLYKDQHGNYYVLTIYGMVKTTLSFFFDQQKTNVETRLDEDEVKYRDEMTEMVKGYLSVMRQEMKAHYGFTGDESELFIGEPEYEYLKEKMANGEELSDIENLQYAYYELDMKVGELVSNSLNNPGCGMGGNSSFLEETDAKPMYDENGNLRFQTLDGLELRQSVDEEGNPIAGAYETLDGEPYEGYADDVYIVRGYPKTDEEGRFLYTDESGKTVYRTQNMDGSYTYGYEDGTAYEGDTEALTQQLDEINLADEFKKLEEEMKKLLEEYKAKYQ